MRIGVDLGGTNVRVGLVDSGKIISIKTEPCKALESEDIVVDHICKMITAQMNDDVDYIGIGVPSIVDAQQGIVYNAANIPSWKKVHLKAIIEKRFNLPVAVNNDCNYFALGVCAFGEGMEFDNVVCVALGTGVGAGIILNKRLYMGSNTGAGEIGEINYLDSNIENYCSSQFFVNHGTTGYEAYMKAKQGDAEMLQLWSDFGGHVGSMMMSILYVYDPEAIVIGGSIAQAYDLYSESMYEKLKEFPYPVCVDKFKILVSKIENISLLGSTVEI